MVAVTTAIVLSMTGCGNEDEQAASTEWEKVDNRSVDAATTETGADFASVVDEGDEDPEPIEVQIGRLIVDMPGCYEHSFRDRSEQS